MCAVYATEACSLLMTVFKLSSSSPALCNRQGLRGECRLSLPEFPFGLDCVQLIQSREKTLQLLARRTTKIGCRAELRHPPERVAFERAGRTLQGEPNGCDGERRNSHVGFELRRERIEPALQGIEPFDSDKGRYGAQLSHSPGACTGAASASAAGTAVGASGAGAAGFLPRTLASRSDAFIRAYPFKYRLRKLSAPRSAASVAPVRVCSVPWRAKPAR